MAIGAHEDDHQHCDTLERLFPGVFAKMIITGAASCGKPQFWLKGDFSASD
jgi:hypothetical protein